MKSILSNIFAALTAFLFFGGCIDFTNDHTSFKGKVIETNNLPLDNVKLLFESHGRESFVTINTKIDTVLLDADGNFEFTINSHQEGIDHIGIAVAIDLGAKQDFELIDHDLYACFPFACGDFEDGKKYEFDIKVTLHQKD